MFFLVFFKTIKIYSLWYFKLQYSSLPLTNIIKNIGKSKYYSNKNDFFARNSNKALNKIRNERHKPIITSSYYSGEWSFHKIKSYL